MLKMNSITPSRERGARDTNGKQTCSYVIHVIVQKVSRLLAALSCFDGRNVIGTEQCVSSQGRINSMRDGGTLSLTDEKAISKVGEDVCSSLDAKDTYTSSNLMEPFPEWTAYKPCKGIAWAPTPTHLYTCMDEDSDKPSILSPNSSKLKNKEFSEKQSSSPLSSGSDKSYDHQGIAIVSDLLLIQNTISNPASINAMNQSEELPVARKNNNCVCGAPVADIQNVDEEISQSPAECSSFSDSWSIEEFWNDSFAMDNIYSSLNYGASSQISSLEDFTDFLHLDLSNSSCEYYNEGISSEIHLEDPDCTEFLIPRVRIRTGKLLHKDSDNNYCVCNGILRTKENYPRCIQPVNIQINKGLNSVEDRLNFFKNIEVIKKLHHRNILSIFGICIEGSPLTREGIEFLVLTERTHFLVTLGRLIDWSAENNASLFSVRVAVDFSQQILQGLCYLEGKGIVHLNLASHNIRLDSKCCIKLDGIEPYNISTRAVPYRWVAVELLNNMLDLNSKHTVWSFGVVLWEMLSLETKPYPHLKSAKEVSSYLSKGKRLIKPNRCPDILHNLMLHCWKNHQKERPALKQISQKLISYKDSFSSSETSTTGFPDGEDFWVLLNEHMTY